ncbi:glycosyltransferase family 4 protein [Thermanaerothrix sp.]|uniref:glycosyltransferase family 4 protein n=1 Tax=Thermanaerothrix sp. TaxID=2972675 RepID=UPI003C7E87F7
MRFLFLLSQDVESSASAGRYFPIAKELAQRGHDIVILGLHPNFRLLSKRVMSTGRIKIWYVAPMHVIKTKTRKIYYPFYLQILVIVRATLALVLATLRSPADLIYVCKPHPMNGLAGFIASRVKGIPLIVDCDDYEAQNNRFHNSLEQWVVKKFEKWLLAKAHYITVHTLVLRAHFVSEGLDPDRIIYLPHGIDTSRFNADNLSPEEIVSLQDALNLAGKKVIAYIGSFSRVTHALDILLEAFEKVRAELPDAILLLVGRGEDYDWVKQQIRHRGIEQFVRVCEWVPPDRVFLYYKLAHVAVDPVYDNVAARCSLSLKIFDSWACNIPLITTDVGDRRRILGEPPAGLVVPPNDSNALGAGILTVLKDQTYAALLAERGQQRVEIFRWARLIEIVEEISCRAVRKAMKWKKGSQNCELPKEL